MEELRQLEEIYEKQLVEIRKKEKKVLNDYTKYDELQEKLRCISRVMNMIRDELYKEVK